MGDLVSLFIRSLVTLAAAHVGVTVCQAGFFQAGLFQVFVVPCVRMCAHVGTSEHVKNVTEATNFQTCQQHPHQSKPISPGLLSFDAPLWPLDLDPVIFLVFGFLLTSADSAARMSVAVLPAAAAASMARLMRRFLRGR